MAMGRRVRCSIRIALGLTKFLAPLLIATGLIVTYREASILVAMLVPI
jgi:hypothetical protein